MNKKFLSAILFGALMVTSTGTFVSCKDYDDDIENLQSQINNLATKSDVEAKLSQLQAAIDAAKAESAANASKIAALTKCECDVDAMMAKIQAAVDADMAGYKAEIEALVAEVEALVGKVADFVTSVELVSSETLNGAGFPRVLDFMTITEKENIFEEDITGAIEFVKGKQIQVATSSLLVRVSPTNAVLTPEMISLVNSKGQNLDEYVDIKVSAYTDLLTRSAENNGLWKLTVTLKEKNDDVFAAIKLSDKKEVLYAVQVNNALEAAEARYVTSGYDVVLGKSENFTPAKVLDFNVTDAYGKEFNVAKINNRFGNQSKSLKEKGTATMYKELTWATSTTAQPTPAVAGTDKNTVAATAAEDDRQLETAIKAVQGEPITIAIPEALSSKVRAIYVTLDKANAVESAPSELNAWNSYSYTGLNEVVEATSTTITVNASTAINDYIGFRVYAVNYDGTLVDPDGRAFYVLVGDVADEWNVAATTIVPDADINTLPSQEKSNNVAVTTTKLTGAHSMSWSVDKDNVPFSIVLADKDGKQMWKLDNNSGVSGTYFNNFKYEDVKYVYTIPANGKAWTDYEDDKEYIGTFKVENAEGFVLATLRVSMTKVLPTTLPAGFTFKDKQIIDGVYNCYLEATDWTAGTDPKADGMMKVENFINFGKGNGSQYDLTFAESDKDADGNLISVVAHGNGYINIKNEYVDNTTKHASKVVYNYGKISSVKVDDKFVDYTITAAEFETVWCCFYKSDVHTWGWITREQLGSAYTAKDANGNYTKAMPYNTTLEYAANEASHIGYVFGQNAIDGEFSKTLDKVYSNSLIVTSAKLISNATEKEDYFSVSNDLAFTAIKTDLGSNPKADVPSTLIITCEDYYGHTITIKLPMTVKPRK